MKAVCMLLKITCVAVFFSSCRKDESREKVQPLPVTNPLKVKVTFHANGYPLVFDSVSYTNAAGNPFSVTRLDLYLSAIEVINRRGVTFKSSKVFYVDAHDSSTFQLTVPEIPETDIADFRCCIGLLPSKNISHSLPPVPVNLNMAWPDNMGGGYHFLKLEGRYLTRDKKLFGYAMHLGKNSNLVEVNIPVNLTKAEAADGVRLSMNVSGWFDNRYVFDFNSANYTMGIDSLMYRLSQNGKDVLTIPN